MFKLSGVTTLLNKLLNGTHHKRRDHPSKRVPFTLDPLRAFVEELENA